MFERILGKSTKPLKFPRILSSVVFCFFGCMDGVGKSSNETHKDAKRLQTSPNLPKYILFLKFF